MRGLSSRSRLARMLVGAALLANGCSGPSELRTDTDVGRGQQYDESETFRRAALLASLESRNNGYARLRVERYVPEQWEALPIWAPAVRAATEADIGGAKPAAGF